MADWAKRRGAAPAFMEILLGSRKITASLPPEIFQFRGSFQVPNKFPDSLWGLKRGRSFGRVLDKIALDAK